MKKNGYLFIVFLCSFCLLSCNNNDTRLVDYNETKMVSFIDEANALSIRIIKNDDEYGIIKTPTSMRIIEEDILYIIKDNTYYSSEEGALDLELKDDALQNIEFFVEKFAFSYKEFLNDLKYVKNVNYMGRECYEYNLPLENGSDGFSGWKYTIDIETGFALSRNTYGPNKDFFDSFKLSFECLEFLLD